MAVRMAQQPNEIFIRGPLHGQVLTFSELYRRFFPRLVRLMRPRLGQSAAEDVAQEAFVRFLRDPSRFDQSRPMWPWLKVIATRLAANYALSKAREARLLRDESLLLVDKEEAEWELFEERTLLAQALSRLNFRQRLALSVRYLEDWKPAQAAQFFGLSKTAFEQLLFRARRRLLVEYQNLSRDATSKMRLALPPVFGRMFARVRGQLAKYRSSAQTLRVGPFSVNFANAIAALLAASLILGGVDGLTNPGDEILSSGAEAPKAGGAAQTSQMSAEDISAQAWSLNSKSGFSQKFAVGTSAGNATISGEVTKKKLAVKMNITTEDHTINVPIAINTDADCDYSAVRTLACNVVDLLPQQIP